METQVLVTPQKVQTVFHPDTRPEVRMILERYRKSGRRIRIWYGDPILGIDWLEEVDVIGYVSRSMGPKRIPILLTDGVMGGPAILDHCVVKLADADTRRVLWQHPLYRTPQMRICIEQRGDSLGCVVLVEGEEWARFSSYSKAAQWVAFMRGECMEQPR